VGVAVAFSAPIGGLLYVMEEVASFWQQELGWQIFFACMVAVLSSDTLRSAQSALRSGSFGVFDKEASTVFFEARQPWRRGRKGGLEEDRAGRAPGETAGLAGSCLLQTADCRLFVVAGGWGAGRRPVRGGWCPSSPLPTASCPPPSWWLQVQTQLASHVMAMAPAAVVGIICGVGAILFTVINLKVSLWLGVQCWKALLAARRPEWLGV
jgi:hypothetical protein